MKSRFYHYLFLLLSLMPMQQLPAEVVEANAVYHTTSGEKKIAMSVNNTYTRIIGPKDIPGDTPGTVKKLFGKWISCDFYIPEGTPHSGTNCPYEIYIGIHENDGRLFLQSEKHYIHDPLLDIVEEVKTKTGLVYNMKQTSNLPEGKKNPSRRQRRREYVIDGEYIYVIQVTWRPENDSYPAELKMKMQKDFFEALSSIKINGVKYEGVKEIKKLIP